MKHLKTAVIDIGSNSVRFMVASNDGAINNKQTNSTILADGLAKNNTLNFDAMARTTNAVCAFTTCAKQLNCDNIFIFATEAVRSAKNGAEFVKNLEFECGMPVHVISGTLEAQIGFMGACSTFNKCATVIDVGGASVEIISGDDGKISYAKSLPIGMVRLIDIVGNNRQKIHQYIAQQITQYGNTDCKNTIIAIGGTATSIGALCLNQTVYNAKMVHSSRVTLDMLYKLEDDIFSSSDIVQSFPVLSINRARVIGHGVITMQEILKHLNANSFIVSENDNMEGYILYKSNV